MAAVYPGAIRSFTTKVNNIDIIDAAHPNVLQEEVVAIESTLGANPQISTSPTTGWIPTSTVFATVAERLANIERGLVSDTHPQYVSRTGGSVIVSSASDVRGLVVRAAAGQTVNLQEWQLADGTVIAYINPSGNLVTTGTDQELDNLRVVAWVFG